MSGSSFLTSLLISNDHHPFILTVAEVGIVCTQISFSGFRVRLLHRSVNEKSSAAGSFFRRLCLFVIGGLVQHSIFGRSVQNLHELVAGDGLFFQKEFC